MSIRPILAALVLALFLGLTALLSPAAVRAVPPDEAAAWREDLRYLVEQLRARHGDLFHTLTPAELEARTAELSARIPEMERHEIVVALARLVASVGDGHTALPILFDQAAGLHPLPLRLGFYRDGLWVEATDASLEPLLGGRVTAIGGVPTDEAVARVAPLISRDNDVWIRVVAPHLLARTEVLHAVGLSDDPASAAITVERDGETRTARVDALPRPRPIDHGTGPWSVPLTDDWREATSEAPLHRQRPDRRYWWTEIEGAGESGGILYFHFDQTVNAPHGPTVAQVFDEALAHAEESGLGRFVLDLRDNTGGEGFLTRHLVRELVRWTGRHPGGLFVIVGNRTFSAAQMLVQDLETWTDAVFVGAPTGSSPRFWGDHSMFRLPHSSLLVSAAPTWWQPGGPYDRRPYLAPRVAAEPAFEDAVQGRDPALEAVLAWDRRPRLEDLAAPALAGDPAAARRALLAWRDDPSNAYLRLDVELNRLAYRAARERGWEAALPLFELNSALHQERANPWDSLGEALLHLGRTGEALDAYRRAYDLDPGVGSAERVLREHGGLPDGPGGPDEPEHPGGSVDPHGGG